MPWQLIYTSAPRGIIPGQTGFCTVARSPDIRDALVQKLEQISYYEHPRLNSSATQPTISAFRIIDIRGTPYYVLTKVRDAGLDFTNRTNHLAQHLVFEEAELANLPDPAAILLKWTGWRESWTGGPTLLTSSVGNLPAIQRRLASPAQTWAKLTGDSARAASLLELPYSRGVFLLVDDFADEAVLNLVSESLRLLDPDGQNGSPAWRYPFTTHLQGMDLSVDFVWRCCRSATPGFEQAVRVGQPVAFRGLSVPIGEKALLARSGHVRRPAVVVRASQKQNSSLETLRVRAPREKVRSETGRFGEEPSYEPEAITSDPVIVYGVALFIILAALALFIWPGYLRRKPVPKSAVVSDSVSGSASKSGVQPKTNAAIVESTPTEDQQLFFQLNLRDVAPLLSSASSPIYFIAGNEAILSNAPNCERFLTSSGTNWQVFFHPDASDWSQSEPAKITRNAAGGSLRISHSKGYVTFFSNVATMKIQITGQESQNCSFHEEASSVAFRVVKLGNVPVLNITTKFFPDPVPKLVSLGPDIEEQILRKLPGYSLAWRVSAPSNIFSTFPLRFDATSARQRAETTLAELQGRLAGMKTEFEAELNRELSTNSPKSFRMYLTGGRQASGATYCQFLAVLLKDAAPSLVEKLARIEVVLNKHELIRDAQAQLSNRYPSIFSALPENHLVNTYTVFTDYAIGSSFRRDLLESRRHRNTLEELLTNPDLTLVATNQLVELPLIRVRPATPRTP